MKLRIRVAISLLISGQCLTGCAVMVRERIYNPTSHAVLVKAYPDGLSQATIASGETVEIKTGNACLAVYPPQGAPLIFNIAHFTDNYVDARIFNSVLMLEVDDQFQMWAVPVKDKTQPKMKLRAGCPYIKSNPG